jgi:hypothetical protein
MSFDGKSQLDFFSDASSLWKLCSLNRLCSSHPILESIATAESLLTIFPPLLWHDEKLFRCRNIYNEASETFAGA